MPGMFGGSQRRSAQLEPLSGEFQSIWDDCDSITDEHISSQGGHAFGSQNQVHTTCGTHTLSRARKGAVSGPWLQTATGTSTPSWMPLTLHGRHLRRHGETCSRSKRLSGRNSVSSLGDRGSLSSARGVRHRAQRHPVRWGDSLKVHELMKEAPDLLDYPTAAILVPASVPLMIQEASHSVPMDDRASTLSSTRP